MQHSYNVHPHQYPWQRQLLDSCTRSQTGAVPEMGSTRLSGDYGASPTVSHNSLARSSNRSTDFRTQELLDEYLADVARIAGLKDPSALIAAKNAARLSGGMTASSQVLATPPLLPPRDQRPTLNWCYAPTRRDETYHPLSAAPLWRDFSHTRPVVSTPTRAQLPHYAASTVYEDSDDSTDARVESGETEIDPVVTRKKKRKKKQRLTEPGLSGLQSAVTKATEENEPVTGHKKKHKKKQRNPERNSIISQSGITDQPEGDRSASEHKHKKKRKSKKDKRMSQSETEKENQSIVLQVATVEGPNEEDFPTNGHKKKQKKWKRPEEDTLIGQSGVTEVTVVNSTADKDSLVTELKKKTKKKQREQKNGLINQSECSVMQQQDIIKAIIAGGTVEEDRTVTKRKKDKKRRESERDQVDGQSKVDKAHQSIIERATTVDGSIEQDLARTEANVVTSADVDDRPATDRKKKHKKIRREQENELISQSECVVMHQPDVTQSIVMINTAEEDRAVTKHKKHKKRRESERDQVNSQSEVDKAHQSIIARVSTDAGPTEKDLARTEANVVTSAGVDDRPATERKKKHKKIRREQENELINQSERSVMHQPDVTQSIDVINTAEENRAVTKGKKHKKRRESERDQVDGQSEVDKAHQSIIERVTTVDSSNEEDLARTEANVVTSADVDDRPATERKKKHKKIRREQENELISQSECVVMHQPGVTQSIVMINTAEEDRAVTKGKKHKKRRESERDQVDGQSEVDKAHQSIIERVTTVDSSNEEDLARTEANVVTSGDGGDRSATERKKKHKKIRREQENELISQSECVVMHQPDLTESIIGTAEEDRPVTKHKKRRDLLIIQPACDVTHQRDAAGPIIVDEEHREVTRSEADKKQESCQLMSQSEVSNLSERQRSVSNRKKKQREPLMSRPEHEFAQQLHVAIDTTDEGHSMESVTEHRLKRKRPREPYTDEPINQSKRPMTQLPDTSNVEPVIGPQMGERKEQTEQVKYQDLFSQSNRIESLEMQKSARAGLSSPVKSLKGDSGFSQSGEEETTTDNKADRNDVIGRSEMVLDSNVIGRSAQTVISSDLIGLSERGVETGARENIEGVTSSRKKKGRPKTRCELVKAVTLRKAGNARKRKGLGGVAEASDSVDSVDIDDLRLYRPGRNVKAVEPANPDTSLQPRVTVVPLDPVVVVEPLERASRQPVIPKSSRASRPVSQSQQSYKCEFCKLEFGSAIGQGQHTKRTHPDKYVSRIDKAAQERLANQNAFRWSVKEKRAMAEFEARYIIERGVKPSDAVLEYEIGRHRNSVNRIRKRNANYRAMFETALRRLGDRETATARRTCLPAADCAAAASASIMATADGDEYEDYRSVAQFDTGGDDDERMATSPDNGDATARSDTDGDDKAKDSDDGDSSKLDVPVADEAAQHWCFECQRVFSDGRGYVRHAPDCTAEDAQLPFQCELCPGQFRFAVRLKQHMQQFHRPKGRGRGRPRGSRKGYRETSPRPQKLKYTSARLQQLAQLEISMTQSNGVIPTSKALSERLGWAKTHLNDIRKYSEQYHELLRYYLPDGPPIVSLKRTEAGQFVCQCCDKRTKTYRGYSVHVQLMHGGTVLNSTREP